MLYLNVVRVLNLRGIVKHAPYLQKHGFIRTTAYNYANNQVWEIRFSNLEKLCLLLNCTPNDLFQWKPDADQVVTEETALKAIMRDHAAVEISQLVKNMPLEKLEKVKEMLAQMDSEE